VSEGERPVEPRRSGWARWIRRALLAVGILAAAVGVGVHLPPVQRRLVDFALAKLRSPLGADIRFESIHYNLFARTVSIDGLRVGAFGQAPLVSAQHVFVRYAWATYRGELDGLEVTLENADVTLIHEETHWITVPAKWTAPRAPTGPPRPLPAFAALHLHNVNVHYEDREAKFVARTRGLSVDLVPTESGTPGDLAGVLGTGAKTEISWYPRTSAFTIVSGRAHYSPQGTGVSDLRVQAAEGTIHTNVGFTFHGADRLQLKAHGDLRGEALHTWLPLLDTLTGNLSVDFQIPASHGAPAFADVAVRGKDISWQKVLVSDLATNGALETGGITLADLRVVVGSGSAQGHGRLAWAEAGQSNAALDFRNMDAGRLWRTLLASSPGALYVAPGSIVSGRFEGNWDAWHAAAIDARLQTTWRRRSSGLARGERLWLDGRVDVRFERGPWIINVDARADGALRMRGRIQTRGSAADYSRWPLSGTLALSGPVVPIVVDAFRYADLDVRPQFADATGDLTGTAVLSRTFGTARAALDLRSELTWPDQPAVAVNLNATVDPAAVQVTSFTAASGESTASATTTINLDRNTIVGQFTGSKIPVESWTRRFGVEIAATGPVDVTGQVSGPVRRPVVEGNVEGGPILFAGQHLSPVAVHVQYTNGVLTLDDISVTGAGGGQLTGRASYTSPGGVLVAGLQATGLALDFTVPGLTTTLGATEGHISARLDGDISVGGTTESPTVKAKLSAPGLFLDAADFGPLIAQVTTEGTRAHADVRADALGAHASGDVELSGARQFSTELTIHTPDSPFGAYVNGIEMSLGAVDLVAHASGSVEEQKLDSADLAIDRLAAIVHDQPIALAPGARATWRPEAIEVLGVDLSSGSTNLTLSGRLDGDPGHALQARLTGHLEDLRPSVATFMPDGTKNMVLNGAFSASANATGSVESPVITGDLNLDGATVGDGVKPPVTGIKVRASLDRSQLALQVAEGHWQGAHAAIAGTVPSRFLKLPGATPGGHASLTGHVDDVTIKVLEPFISTEALRATDFNVRIEYSIAAKEPTVEAATAEVRVVDATIGSREMTLKQEAPARLTLRNGVATLDPWTVVGTLKSHLTLEGHVTLTGTPSVDAKANGDINLRSLALVIGSLRPGGNATISASVTGPLSAPSVQGDVTIGAGELLVRDPRLIFSDITGTIRFSGDQMTVENVTGSMNGGSITANGTMRLPGRGQATSSIAIKINGALFDEPRGFRSMVDADLTLAGRPQDSRIVLGGTATIVEAAFRESLIVTGGLLSLFQPKPQFGPTPQLATATGPELLVLNIQVLANDSITIDTSYGRVSVGTNLRLYGPPSAPRLRGQADVAPGGQIYFGGHTYQIQSARLEFNDPNSLTPSVHLVARTTIGGYNITMRIDTEEGRTETRLSSDPPLPEDQIASLMVSGTRTATASAGDLVTQQLAAALSGEITSAVGRAVGLDSVRIESGNPGDLLFDPSLISADSNPAQRLTFSKKVLPTLEVIVSQNLRESGQITYVVSWDVTSHFELRFVQLDNQDRSYEIRHDISFGGGSAITPVRRRIPERVRNVYIAAFGDITEAEIRQRLRITEGRNFDFFKWQQDRDRIESLYRDRGFFEARITARRDPPSPPATGGNEPTPVDLGYSIDGGPPTSLVVNGVRVPGALREALIDAWVDTPVDSLLNDEFSALLRPWLAERGYVQSSVTTNVATVGRTKTATISVETGVRFTSRELLFTGNSAISSSDLNRAVRQSPLGSRLWVNPSDLQTVLLGAYHDRGHLAAQITIGSPNFTGTRAELPVEIVEGPLFVVGYAKVLDPGPPPEGVDLTSPIAPGTTLNDRLVRDAQRQLLQRYRLAGFRGTHITPESTARSDKSTVDLVFKVTRGQRMSIGTITIAGVDGPERALVERVVNFTPGQPVSLDKLNTARDRLYDTDVFRTVAIDMQPRRPVDGQPPTGVMDTTITVEPLPKYRLQYGFQLFDPYKPAVSPKWGSVDPGIVVDLTRRALFGHGITGGLAGRANPADRVVRAYLSSRRFFGINAQTNLYFGDEWQRQISDLGLSVEQRTRDYTFDQRIQRRAIQIAYGYNFENLDIRIFGDPSQLENIDPNLIEELEPGQARVKANVSRLLGSFFYDRRDNAIDSTRGWFHSTSGEFAPEWLGSTQGYRKYLNQDFFFLPLPGTVVLASGARLEIASGAGQFFITSERLRAGGATTVRGYDDVSLALLTQQDVNDRTELLVWNEEIRFPIYRRFRGATFWDHANFFGNFELPDLTRTRNSVGVGIRFVLPFILFRLDYGYPLNQDPINNHGRWYFAIGQAF
jgi:outer membrane protein assembly factor BamA/autotransporter translocation and assembly factor TamB